MSKIIQAEDKTVRELLDKAKYSVDNYQREYKWEDKQVAELVDDLWGAFVAHFSPSHQTGDTKKYGEYFLGSVVVSGDNIVDGQQRLTSLTLVLICLRNLCRSEGSQKLREFIAPLVQSSDEYEKTTFNIYVDDRNDCLNALYSGESGEQFKSDDNSESVRNLAGRYENIMDGLEGKVDDKLDGVVDEQGEHSLKLFAYWLMNKVRMVKITASSDSDAYAVFETTNDRGLRLTPTDMLKNFLLSKNNENERDSVVRQWKESTAELVNYDKNEDADAIKAWLRARYAETARRRAKNAAPGDFELIGTQFHRWVRDNSKQIGLKAPEDFARFVKRDMKFYTRQYLQLREAADNFSAEQEFVYYNGENEFNLQYPALLATLLPDDPQDLIMRKVRLVSRYLDALLYRRILSRRKVDRSTLEYAMYILIRDMRNKSMDVLPEFLRQKLQEDEEYDPQWFGLFNNRPKVRRVLARITDYITVGSTGKHSHYTDYVDLEIEHIWANHPEWFSGEFSEQHEFGVYRNYIGGLLLLPKKDNSSYTDKRYDEKREHYVKQNLLAQSLHPNCYKNNPGFLQFVKDKKLPFNPYAEAEFTKKDLDERHALYVQIAEQIWNPDNLLSE